jgi:hypothetical protein
VKILSKGIRESNGIGSEVFLQKVLDVFAFAGSDFAFEGKGITGRCWMSQGTQSE